MATSFLPFHPPQSLPFLHRRPSLTPTPPRRLTHSFSLSSSLQTPSSTVSVEDYPPPPLPSDDISHETNASSGGSEGTQLRGCKACGRAELEKGCNGEGRIQGGIATVPGFGWWPIKAYRPCPGFVESGGRYRRRGQSMDEVAFGRGERETSSQSTEEGETRKTRKGPKRLKG